MKKAFLSLSIGLILSATNLTYATTDLGNTHTLDSVDGVQDHSRHDTVDTTELLRADVERLYPQYLKQGEDDSLYSGFLEDYKYRKLWSQYFARSEQYLNLYQIPVTQEKLREIDPDLSKLDAMLYPDLTRIYQSLDQIQNKLKPTVHFRGGSGNLNNTYK